MGWTYPYHTHTRRELIADRIKPWSNGRTIRHCLRGNVLWKLMEVTDKVGSKTTFIALDLLQKHGTWGYKDLDESCGPYYASCPESYLEHLSTPINEYSRGFRRAVRAYHAQRRLRLAASRS